MSIHPVFQRIFDTTFPALSSTGNCTICGEEECICEYCPHCTLKDVPIETLAGRECPNCGESIAEVNEDPDAYEENAYFIKTETEGLIKGGH